MIVINFKNYKKGKSVLVTAKKIQKYLPKAIVAVPATDIKEVSKKTRLRVYAQHVDYKDKGRNTGFVLPESVKKDGAKGSLLNHSEHRIKGDIIKNTIRISRKNKLKIILCVKNTQEAKNYKKLKPYAIAFEDPKLIATGKSITKYDTKKLKKFVKMLEGTGIISLCGSGIDSKEDYKEALKLGCKGVLVSSVVMTSKSSERFLKGVS